MGRLHPGYLNSGTPFCSSPLATFLPLLTCDSFCLCYTCVFCIYAFLWPQPEFDIKATWLILYMTNKPSEGRQIVASIVPVFAAISRRQGAWHVSSKLTERVGSQNHRCSNKRCTFTRSRGKMFIFLGNFSFVDPGSSEGLCLTPFRISLPRSCWHSWKSEKILCRGEILAPGCWLCPHLLSHWTDIPPKRETHSVIY